MTYLQKPVDRQFLSKVLRVTEFLDFAQETSNSPRRFRNCVCTFSFNYGSSL